MNRDALGFNHRQAWLRLLVGTVYYRGTERETSTTHPLSLRERGSMQLIQEQWPSPYILPFAIVRPLEKKGRATRAD